MDVESPVEARTERSDVSRSPSLPAADARQRAPAGAGGANGVPAKRIGRPPGYPKSGGRRKGADSKVGKEGREWLAENSRCLDVLARVCAGKAVKMAGPTGKKLWHYPTWEDQKWAAELLLPRLVPALSSAELTGADGGPLSMQAGLVGFLQSLPDPEEDK